MSDFPLAYHITFGTYGTRLHGDERGTIDRRQNKPGDPIIGRNDRWGQYEAHLLSYSPILFSENQRLFIQSILPAICERGDWTHHCSACQDNHIHIMLSTSSDGKTVRRLLKRWLSQKLSAKYPICDQNANESNPRRGRRGSDNVRVWWAKGGSVKWVWDDFYLDAVYQYIVEQRM